MLPPPPRASVRASVNVGFAELVDDSEDPVYEVHPAENVYSYFMFISPTEARKEGEGLFTPRKEGQGVVWTFDMIMATILVLTSFLMQGVVIYAVFNEVVFNNYEWQNGIMKVGSGAGALDLFKTSTGQECNDGGSLCFLENGTYSCAPPSVQLTGRWDELDVNGDGLWTLEEVEQEREKLQCKYALDAREVFGVFHKFLLKREDVIWLHPDVKAGKLIHKDYFNFARGDIIMCGYRNQDMCPNLLKMGIFDAPLQHGTSPRVGTSVDSALSYCYELLGPGGICERTLPSSYSAWKVESVDQCRSPEYEKFTYKGPGSSAPRSLLAVDYKARRLYARAQTPLFLCYKGVIICLWIFAMVYEFKQIVVHFTWVLRFPDAKEFGKDAVMYKEDGGMTIQGITRPHRICVGVMVMVRFTLTLIVSYAGISFLSRQTDWIGILLDGVALVFIVQIADMLYLQTLRDEVRKQTEDIEHMKVDKIGIDFFIRRPGLVDMLWFILVVGLSIYIVLQQYESIVVPVHDALDCTCRSAGEKCVEAQKFSPAFWEKYWGVEVPAVFDWVRSQGAPAAVPPADVGQRNLLFSAHRMSHIRHHVEISRRVVPM